MVSDVDLKPLPTNFFDLWNIVNRNWNLYKTSVSQILPYQQAKATTSPLTTTTNQLSELTTN